MATCLHSMAGVNGTRRAALGIGIGDDEGVPVPDLRSYEARHLAGTRSLVELARERAPAHSFELRRFIRSENQFECLL